MKTKFLLILSAVILFMGSANAKEIPVNVAETVAKNFIYERTGQRQSDIVLETETYKKSGQNIYYIFRMKGDGFVLVSADDNYIPILGFSFENNFKTENQPANVKAWLLQYESAIKYVRQNKVKAVDDGIWDYYTTPTKAFNINKDYQGEIVVDGLTKDILWNQDGGWNEACPEDADGPDGHVYAGCVATAMSIVMKYWEYPLNGVGQHSYYASGYGNQSVNYSESNYMWKYMAKDKPNWFIAKLMYDAGVSVNMSYAADGSGTYSYLVPNALKNYFQYPTSVTHVSMGYLTAWHNTLKAQFDADQPVYYSGHSDDGGHAFVCDGYTSDNYFHFNFGWSGYTNGFWHLDTVGDGFSQGQAAVINIVPPSDKYPYPESPVLQGSIDTNDFSSFKVYLNWENPSAKNVSKYVIYREDQIIEDNYTETSYTDENLDIDNYNYAVRAVYDDNKISLEGASEIKGKFKVSFDVTKANGDIIHPGTAIFNGEEEEIYFGEVDFKNIPFGGDYEYTVMAEGYPDYTSSINIYKDTKIKVVFGSIDLKEEAPVIIAYPNPSNGMVSFSGLDAQNSLKVFDITGKLVFATENIKSNSNIDLTSLQKGIYLLKINNNGKAIEQKIVIK